MSQAPETSRPARKRRLLQFHLSTAVILMLVAGGLMCPYANLLEHIPTYERAKQIIGGLDLVIMIACPLLILALLAFACERIIRTPWRRT